MPLKKYGTSWTDVDEPETVEIEKQEIEAPQSEENSKKSSVQDDEKKECAPVIPSTPPISFGKTDAAKPFSFGKAEENKPEGSAPKFVFNPVASESKTASATPLFSFKPKPDSTNAESEGKSPTKTSFFSNLPSADSGKFTYFESEAIFPNELSYEG